MINRAFDAILLDLDGTLLSSDDSIHPRNVEALRQAELNGVRVMVVTGRSMVSALPVIEKLELDALTVMFNGAAVWCPQRRRLIEERTLSNRTVQKALAYGQESDDLTIVMRAHDKQATRPRTPLEERALLGLHGVEYRERDELERELVIRITFLGERFSDSGAYARDVQTWIQQPVYMTDFPLSVLPLHRDSKMHAVDVHPPCRGKAEALRVMEDHYGIPPERVVAVGDATNDLPMLQAAGLGVAMENSMAEVLAVIERQIGHHDQDSIADLVQELFLH